MLDLLGIQMILAIVSIYAAPVLALTLLLWMYFFPSKIARQRLKSWTRIFVINLLLGWTFIGWVYCCVSAYTTNEEDQN